MFKIDTGSDISILNERLAKGLSRRIDENYCSLKYPTGETVVIRNKVVVRVELGKYSLDVPMLIARISDDCILGTDFLKVINLEGVFEPVFGNGAQRNHGEFSCSRIDSTEKVPKFLKQLFEENSGNLDSEQKGVFAEFLNEFQDVFSEDITAGNCEVVEHSINIRDSEPIKQVPRRVPIHLRGKVDQIIQEMKSQGVIEESQSPWVSPVVLVKKKDDSLRFCVDYGKLNCYDQGFLSITSY